MQLEPRSPCDPDTLKTWHNVLSTATSNPELKHYLSRQQDRLLPCFAEHYEKLRVLARRMRRTLQRQWKRSLGCIALLLALGQTPASAAVIKVGGACTLIRAIVAANNATTATGVINVI